MINIVLIIFVAAMVASSYNVWADNPVFLPVVPEKCKKQGYCLDTDMPYPTEYVEALPEDVLDTSRKIHDLIDDNARRMLKIEICRTRKEVIFPLIARDENEDWWYVAQNKQGIQGWRVELCDKEGTDCNAQDAHGHQGKCTQKFLSHFTSVLDTNGNVVTKPLMVPQTCFCKVTM